MRKIRFALIAACAIATAASYAQPGPDETRNADSATSTSESDIKDSHGVIVNLTKGVDVNQIVKFLSEQTGKPVLKDSGVSGKIVVYSEEKIPSEDAVQLIFDAMELAGIAVIETPRLIKLIPSDKAKTMEIPMLEADDRAASITNKTLIIQKVFKLRTTSPKSIQEAIKPLIGKQGTMGMDERTRSLVITDTAANVQRFEQLIDAFDRVEEGQMSFEIFKLQHADAEELADLLATMALAGEGGEMEVRQRRDSYSYYRARSGRGSGGRVAGDVVVIPDVRTNWLIAIGPPDKVEPMKKLVEQIDVPGFHDVSVHVIEVKHADAYDIASDIEQMFENRSGRRRLEAFDVDSSNRGNSVLVLGTEELFQEVLELVKQLDTPESVERETRTYELKYMDANDMAEQLNVLFEDEAYGRSYYSSWGYGGRGSSRQEARFVPSVRTNSLMVIAQPNDYEFIEEMIKELDVEIPNENLAPRVFYIKNTDATELKAVLTELFEGEQQRRTSGFDYWRPRSRSTLNQGGVGALYGKVRFVVYTNTNSIVVITNNPQNLPVVAKLIEDLDVLDPEATNMLVVQLKFADATEVANNINNLLSDGPVARQNQQQQQRQQQNRNNEETNAEDEPPPVPAVFPWQSSQRRQTRAGEEERPISSLIGQVRIVPDPRSQKLIVAAPSIYFPGIKQLINDLDQPEPQVQLDTFIVRIAKNYEKRTGWRWTPDPGSISPEELDNAFLGLVDMGFIDTFAYDGFEEFSSARNFEGGRSETRTRPAVDVTRGVADVFRGGEFYSIGQTLQPGRGVLATDVNLAILLQLLIKNRDAQVVAHPQVTVNNNESGEIFVGESVPFETGSVTSTEGRASQTTVDYGDVGTRLEIKPQINKEGRVVLRIRVENSRRKPELLGGRIITELQTYNTKLTVEDSQTVWLGGLKEERLDNVIRKVPILGDIPVIKYFFRKTDKVTLEDDIYTFVTPTVMVDAVDVEDQYRKAREQIRKSQQEFKDIDLELPGDGETTDTLNQKADASPENLDEALADAFR